MSPAAFRILRLYAVVMAAVLLAPLLIVIATSLTSGGWLRFPPEEFGLRWIVAALHNRSFLESFLFSFTIGVIVAVIASLLAMSTAVAIARFEFPGKNAVQAYLMSSFLLPNVVIAIGLIQMLSILRWPTTPLGLIAGHVITVFPLVLRLCVVSLQSADPMVEKAAYSLGASRLYVFRRLTIPQVASGVLSGALIAFLLSFDETVIAIFTAAPGRTTLPVMIYNYVEQRSDPLIAAVSSIKIVFAAIVIILADRKVGVLQLLSGGQIGSRNETAGH